MPYVAADYLIERLAQYGARTLFGVPAVYCAAVFDAASETRTSTRGGHQQRPRGRLRGRRLARVHGLSALAVSYGPGNLSIVNAIAAAYIERSPIVVVNGGPSQGNIDDQDATGVLFSHSMGRSRTPIWTYSPTSRRSASAATRIDDSTGAGGRRVSRPRWPPASRLPGDTAATAERPCAPPAGALDTSDPVGAAYAAATTILQAIGASTNPRRHRRCRGGALPSGRQAAGLLDRLQSRWTTTVVGEIVLLEQSFGIRRRFQRGQGPRRSQERGPVGRRDRRVGAVFASGPRQPDDSESRQDDPRLGRKASTVAAHRSRGFPPSSTAWTASRSG